MSRTTREINRVTGIVINVSLKLILLALVCILMYEGVTRGYSFGHEIFDPTPMESGEGTAKQVTVEDCMSVMEMESLRGKRADTGRVRLLIESILYEYEIQPGTYTFRTTQTSMEILQMLSEGPKAEETGEEEARHDRKMSGSPPIFTP